MFAFILIAILLLGSALAAILLRNLVHAVLALTVTFASLAALYLQLAAQFVGFAQLLVYVGAVAILIVFALLLTRGAEPSGTSIFARGWGLGAGVALLLFCLLAAIELSGFPARVSAPPSASVREIGIQLMTNYVLPLEILGLLLTAALIGAVLIAMPEPDSNEPPTTDH